MSSARFTRRETLRLGVGAMGLSLPTLLNLKAAAQPTSRPKGLEFDGFGRAKS